LQHAYNKHGNKLVYKVEELCAQDDLRTREQLFLDTRKPIFNISKDAYNPMHDPEIKAKWDTIMASTEFRTSQRVKAVAANACPQLRETHRRNSTIMHTDLTHKAKVSARSKEYWSQDDVRDKQADAMKKFYAQEGMRDRQRMLMERILSQRIYARAQLAGVILLSKKGLNLLYGKHYGHKTEQQKAALALYRLKLKEAKHEKVSSQQTPTKLESGYVI
jgi:hypothetical protein